MRLQGIKKLAFVILLLAGYGVAAEVPVLADQVILEQEPNNTFLTAQPVFSAAGPIIISGSVRGVDASTPDYFRFYAEAGSTLTFTSEVTGLLPSPLIGFRVAVPFLRLYAPTGTQIAGTQAFQNILVFTVSESGFYAIAITALDIDNTDFEYLLRINGASPAPVPEPATMLLLGTGLAAVGAAVRRRRRVAS